MRSLAILTLVAIPTIGSAAEPAVLTFVHPVPHQIVQRFGFAPERKQLGSAEVAIRGSMPAGLATGTWEFRAVVAGEPSKNDTGWETIDVRTNGLRFEGIANVTAGWHRFELRCRMADRVLSLGTLEPVGVGELFLVGGQSYATNCNDERFRVTDAKLRVSAYDSVKKTWAVAHDPQPVFDGSDGGSIWPPLGDRLAKEFGVPIGFANAAIGGSSSEEWMPNGTLQPRMAATGVAIGAFRAVLWQQGESDVIIKTPTAKYVENIRTIRTTCANNWEYDAPWLLAKSTHHPTVYNDADGEGRIRAGIDALAKRPGFRAGPDTDTLKGENRGDAKSRRHFSAVGQKRAADMWFDTLKVIIAEPGREPVSALRLWEPAWASKIVHRESSVLFRKSSDSPAIARLAFPIAKILSIENASRTHRYDIAKADGTTITFAKPEPVEPILEKDFYLLKDALNSYRHRTGHPEQYMLYRPGRWFHDRDVEVTYVRSDVGTPLPALGTLPKTRALLKAHKPIILGISGDSISTGSDASGIAKIAPFQPGYPDLVAEQLRASFQSSVSLKNRSVGGWSVANGVQDLDKLLAEKPNLIVVAYGMNDVGRRDPKWYGEQTRTILERIRAANPEVEVILVSSMLGNSEWVHTPPEMFAKYCDELKALTGQGVALADATAVWERMLTNKHHHDLTGNGLNHPNDFGHRLYAEVVLSVLKPEAE